MARNALRFSGAVLTWAAVLFSGGVAARGQGRGGELSQRGYEEIRRLARDLDRLAQHAANQAAHPETWVYRHDPNFVRSIVRFAERAHRFNERIDTYRTQRWQVDDDLRVLLREARDVQSRARRAGHGDNHTIDDWNRVVGLLNQMIRVYRADVARRPWSAGYDYEQPYAADLGRRAPASGPNPPRHGKGVSAERGQVLGLARDLAQRSDRIANYAKAAAGPFLGNDRQRAALDALEHFRDQARDFRERVESGLSGGALASQATHLAQDARFVDQQIEKGNVFPQVRTEWEEILRLVDRIQAIAGR
jgi:hypothetical protein